MKAPEYVKSKAMEKLKEVSNNKGGENTIKAQQYIEGLLKIPFYQYQEEVELYYLKQFKSNLKEILKSLLKHRYIILNKRINFQLNKIKKRLEILKGFLTVYKNLNKIIKIIRNSKDPKKELIKKYKFYNIQVEAILEMRLRNLKKIEEFEIKKEFKNLEIERKRLTKIINSKTLQIPY